MPTAANYRDKFVSLLRENPSREGGLEGIVRSLIGWDAGDPDLVKFEMIDPGVDFDQVDWFVQDFVTLRATDKIDPLLPTSGMPGDVFWGIQLYIDRDTNQLMMTWGNMDYSGDRFDPSMERESEIYIDTYPPIGLRQTATTQLTAMEDESDPDFILREPSVLDPHVYDITVTERGFAIAVFNQSVSESWKQMSWVQIQRLINEDGTTTYLNDKAPIFVLWNNLSSKIDDPDDGIIPYNVWYKGVLRETDIKKTEGSQLLPLNPSDTQITESFIRPDLYQRVDFSGQHTIWTIPTDWDQPATQDDGSIGIIVPTGITTSRNSYIEKMDLSCFGPSCLFTIDQEFPVVINGVQKTYRALIPSDDCKGVIIAILVNGPEFM